MQRDSEGSPYRRSVWNEGDEDESVDPFSIFRTKSASIERLKRWRQAALVLNASRRYRYTLDLNKEEEKQQIIRMIRTHAQVIRAAHSFKTLEKAIDPDPTPIPTGGYGIGPEQLHSMTRDHDVSLLEYYGGVKGLATMLKTDAEKGIQDEEADILHRRNVFGSNTYPHKKEKIFLRFLWDACQDVSLIILIVAAVASLVLGIQRKAMKQGLYDGGSIALAVIISIIVTAISDHRQSLEFQSLNKEKQKIDCEVIRGGLRQCVSVFDIVVGDVVHLRIGDMVPADGIFISGFSLAIDESNMTGESRLVRKDLRSPFLMAGCKVADGYGTMLVTSVGISTEWGLLMATISEDNGEETPLQVHLNGVATLVGTIGLVVAFGVFFVLMVRYFTGHTENLDGSVQFRAGETRAADSVDEAVKIFTIAVTIAMIAVPEGLPLAIILTLAYSVKKMIADKILVRRLSACELMGSATTICSDKTGTLTLNQMTVVEAFICEKKIESPGNNRSSIPPAVTSLLIEGIAHNTTGSVFMPESGQDIVVFGSPTEKAILHWGLKLGMNFDAVRVGSSIIHAFLFNSEKKRGGVAVKLPDSKVHIHWKGAAEIVLDNCTRYIDANGCLVPMNEDKMTLLKKVIEDMAVRSLRCLALAFRSYELENIPSDEEKLRDWDLPEDELVLLAVVGLKDPVRPGVKDAVRLCKIAGVKVRMVTGDNIQTARTIALECGILTDTEATGPNIIEGRVFRALSDAQKLEIADSISVMGRSSPNDKLMLVQALRKCGHVVAVTGDGTNDAPALHEADIGLAMGIQGTQVAKDSSDIIILDDNFASVVKVIKWGRSVYANIQKFIQFQLTLNVAAVTINFLDAVSSGDVPYNAVQLLWVNLIMDTLGLLAMATERPTDNLMHRPPIGQRELLITNIVWRNLLTQVVYQVIVLVVLNSRFRSMLNLEHDKSDHAAKVKNTLIFNVFIFCQIFNEFNARKPDGINVFKGITRNHFFMATVSLTIVLQVIIITYLGKFTSSVRLGWKLWLLSILIGFISWPLMTIAKLIPVPKAPFSKFAWRNYLKLRTLQGKIFNLTCCGPRNNESTWCC